MFVKSLVLNTHDTSSKIYKFISALSLKCDPEGYCTAQKRSDKS
jgi:hypothetical protein